MNFNKNNFQLGVAKSSITHGFECLTWISNLVWNLVSGTENLNRLNNRRALLVDFLHTFIKIFHAQKSANPGTWFLESYICAQHAARNIKLLAFMHRFKFVNWRIRFLMSWAGYISRFKKKMNSLLVKKGIFSQFWVFEKIKQDITRYYIIFGRKNS